VIDPDRCIDEHEALPRRRAAPRPPPRRPPRSPARARGPPPPRPLAAPPVPIRRRYVLQLCDRCAERPRAVSAGAPSYGASKACKPSCPRCLLLRRSALRAITAESRRRDQCLFSYA
jgi:hypothetical protein